MICVRHASRRCHTCAKFSPGGDFYYFLTGSRTADCVYLLTKFVRLSNTYQSASNLSFVTMDQGIRFGFCGYALRRVAASQVPFTRQRG